MLSFPSFVCISSFMTWGLYDWCLYWPVPSSSLTIKQTLVAGFTSYMSLNPLGQYVDPVSLLRAGSYIISSSLLAGSSALKIGLDVL